MERVLLDFAPPPSTSTSSAADMPRLSPEEIERLARKRAGAKLGWYFHAAVYVVVNLFLLAASARYGVGERPWSFGPLFGWGMGLALHGIAVFVLGQGGGLRERMVQKERERLEREHGGPGAA